MRFVPMKLGKPFGTIEQSHTAELFERNTAPIVRRTGRSQPTPALPGTVAAVVLDAMSS
jgi:hypothetical protein